MILRVLADVCMGHTAVRCARKTKTIWCNIPDQLKPGLYDVDIDGMRSARVCPTSTRTVTHSGTTGQYPLGSLVLAPLLTRPYLRRLVYPVCVRDSRDHGLGGRSARCHVVDPVSPFPSE